MIIYLFQLKQYKKISVSISVLLLLVIYMDYTFMLVSTILKITLHIGLGAWAEPLPSLHLILRY